jgi:hypothetical protein
MHPLSVAELNRIDIGEHAVGAPVRMQAVEISQPMRYGGFPEPFLKFSIMFYNRRRRLRNELLFPEDIDFRLQPFFRGWNSTYVLLVIVTVRMPV